jgi:hypothetical protein
MGVIYYRRISANKAPEGPIVSRFDQLSDEDKEIEFGDDVPLRDADANKAQARRYNNV